MSTPITTIRTSIRPSTEVDFFTAPNLTDYMQTVYVDSGKILAPVRELSDDGLIQTITIVWKDEETLLEFNADSVISDLRSSRPEYNKLHNIISSLAKL